MKCSIVLTLTAGLALAGVPALAQDLVPAATETEAQDQGLEDLDYEDYTVKAYSLTVNFGSYTGFTFLDLPMVGDRTVITPGTGDELQAGDVLGYDGLPLPEARQLFDGTNVRVYDAPIKKIESGTTYGGRIGIYVNDDFHLDLLGSYTKARATLTMVKKDQLDPAKNERLLLSWDDNFTVYKGGLSLVYDARPARFLGLTPRVGFGLGGLINRFENLEDKTSVYIEGTLALTRRFGKSLDVIAQADVTNFAFDVDELGHSNMVNYATFSIGVSWFFDVLPASVRAAREAARAN